MRGQSDRQETMLSLLTPEQRVPVDHPLRKIKVLADGELRRLSGELKRMYSHTGRPSVPPERVLKALVLMALYSVRSERQLSVRRLTDASSWSTTCCFVGFWI